MISIANRNTHCWKTGFSDLVSYYTPWKRILNSIEARLSSLPLLSPPSHCSVPSRATDKNYSKLLWTLIVSRLRIHDAPLVTLPDVLRRRVTFRELRARTLYSYIFFAPSIRVLITIFGDNERAVKLRRMISVFRDFFFSFVSKIYKIILCVIIFIERKRIEFWIVTENFNTLMCIVTIDSMNESKNDSIQVFQE